MLGSVSGHLPLFFGSFVQEIWVGNIFGFEVLRLFVFQVLFGQLFLFLAVQFEPGVIFGTLSFAGFFLGPFNTS